MKGVYLVIISDPMSIRAVLQQHIKHSNQPEVVGLLLGQRQKWAWALTCDRTPTVYPLCSVVGRFSGVVRRLGRVSLCMERFSVQGKAGNP